jgi:hypothetical protein
MLAAVRVVAVADVLVAVLVPELAAGLGCAHDAIVSPLARSRSQRAT